MEILLFLALAGEHRGDRVTEARGVGRAALLHRCDVRVGLLLRRCDVGGVGDLEGVTLLAAHPAGDEIEQLLRVNLRGVVGRVQVVGDAEFADRRRCRGVAVRVLNIAGSRAAVLHRFAGQLLAPILREQMGLDGAVGGLHMGGEGNRQQGYCDEEREALHDSAILLENVGTILRNHKITIELF